MTQPGGLILRSRGVNYHATACTISHCEEPRFIGATKQSPNGTGRSTQNEYIVTSGLLHLAFGGIRNDTSEKTAGSADLTLTLS